MKPLTSATRTLTLVAAAVLAGCVGAKEPSGRRDSYPLAKESYPYVVWVHTFEGVAGVGLDYYITHESVAIATHNDWGRPPREVYSRKLNGRERRRWREFLTSFPLDELEDTYEDLWIVDGLHVYFTCRLGEEEKEIALRNTRQDNLFELCDEIDKFLPEDMKIGIASMPAREEPD